MLKLIRKKLSDPDHQALQVMLEGYEFFLFEFLLEIMDFSEWRRAEDGAYINFAKTTTAVLFVIWTRSILLENAPPVKFI